MFKSSIADIPKPCIVRDPFKVEGNLMKSPLIQVQVPVTIDLKETSTG